MANSNKSCCWVGSEDYNKTYLKRKESIRKQYSLLLNPEQLKIQRIYHELKEAINNSDSAAIRIQESSFL